MKTAKEIWLILGLVWLLAQNVGAAGAQTAHGDLRFVVLGDRTNQADQPAFQTVLEDIRRLKPDLVVTVGDLIQGYKDSSGTAADWDSLLPCLKMLDCPVCLTPGNHDVTTPEVRVLFIRKTGFAPYYSFNHQGHHFVILDNSLSSSETKLDPEQIRWLERDLASARGRPGSMSSCIGHSGRSGWGRGSPTGSTPCSGSMGSQRFSSGTGIATLRRSTTASGT